MSRSRLAETVLALLRDSYIDLEIDWVYSPATYDDKLLVSGPVQFNDAVPGFEGWSDPALPLYVAVGVGLEGDRTLGVLDDLEPNETFTFSPEGFNNLYDEGILKLNRDLFKLVPSRNQFSYRVEDPYVTFLKLSSLVDLWANEARIVLLPLGPKTFALMSFLIALRDDSRVSVWRLSADSVDTPVDRIAAGPILGLSTSSALARSVNHGSQM
ncbi:hypothetical protein ACLTEW_06745 [Gordonia lacunae]|uniref:hypothetical protein n=1 Tax=Gordonia lacunae TaxID=417102 RepID=UPI0039E4A781